MTDDPNNSPKTAAPHETPLDRRKFLAVGGAGIAGLAVAGSFAAAPQAAQPTKTMPKADYPVIDIAALSDVDPEDGVSFEYPDANSPALLVKLGEPVPEGVGPDKDLVAYSILCTHKGCPVNYLAERKMLVCPCHWSSFDPAKNGQMVIGQASQALPRVELKVEGDRVQAVGMDGLIYGRHTNIL